MSQTHAIAPLPRSCALPGLLCWLLLELGRSGRVLGRCHAAMGQHELSAAAFDASIELTKTGRLLMSACRAATNAQTPNSLCLTGSESAPAW